MVIRLEILGVLRAFLDDVELKTLPGQPLRAALLVYLAVERRAAREALATVFWPESDDESARHALRQCLYNLRKALGDGWLETQSIELRATDALESDCMAFDGALDRGDWSTAAELYQGAFLHGVNLLSLSSWEAWVDARRAHYTRAFRRCCREWVNASVAAGDLETALRAAQRWVGPDPLDDEAQHRLIEVLATAGERNEAIRQYESYVRQLEPEGLTPLEGTTALIDAIRNSEIAPPLPVLPVPAGAALHPTAPPRANPPDVPAPDRAGQQSDNDEPTRRRPAASRKALRALALGSAALVLLVSGWLVAKKEPSVLGLQRVARAGLDTTRYAILPISHDSTVSAAIPDLVLLEDAFAQWSGIAITPPFQVREAVARRPQPLSLRDAQEIARELGAGRYTLGSATRVGDSIRFQIGLYDAESGSALAVPSFKVPLDLVGAAVGFDSIAERLLFRGGGRGGRIVARPASRSWPARAAFEAGQQALQVWDLARSDSAFFEATQHDPDFALAHLWVAQVREWRDLPSSSWLTSARQAFDGRAHLAPQDQRVVAALLATATGDRPHACSLFRQLIEADEASFVAWYGLARCLATDSVVVQDASSPSGWAFRSSYYAALVAYQRAFHILPSIHKALHGTSYEEVRGLFFLSRTQPRAGRALPPDTIRFLAYPDLDPVGDTLLFVPHSAVEFNRGLAGTLPRSIDLAVERQRRMFHDIAIAWVAAFPTSAEAAEVMAISLELLRNPEAIRAIERARTLAENADERFHIAAIEVWIRLKFAIPDDPAGIRRARHLADSLLKYTPSSVDDPRPLVSLAVLTGRANLAARYARDPLLAETWMVPGVLAPSAPALLAFASLGGPSDSLSAIESQVVRGLATLIPRERARATDSWLVRAATLAFPDYRFLSLDSLRDRLAAAQVAFTSGDEHAVRDSLTAVAVRRLGRPAYELTFDALYPEAALLNAIGDTQGAIQWLDPSLNDLVSTAPQILSDAARVGGLLRAVVLRARLAKQVGDTATARRWARVITELWPEADPFLQTTLAEMRAISSGAR